ncbi:MAG: hypothetical protein R6V14_05755 [Halanaerobiales bacterium]
MKRYLWIPRVLSIIFIIILSLFALDVFSMETSIFQQIGGFLIQLTPPVILLIILIFFWKKPLYSGLSYILLGIIFALFFNAYSNIYSLLILSIVPAGLGILFIIFRKTSVKK